MYQVVFRIPWLDWPIYGFGLMLFCAFISCTWLAGRRAVREGINPQIIPDLALWLFIGGLLGARTTYLLSESRINSVQEFLYQLPRIWEGGIVLYGSFIGGLIAYLIAYVLIYRKQGLSTLKLVDVIAPCIALGLILGRFGCFLNGCCYGGVVCAESPLVMPVHFPLAAPCRESLVASGTQTVAGFTVVPDMTTRGCKVGQVEPGSAAYVAGLRPGSVIVGVNGQEVRTWTDIHSLLGSLNSWPRGQGWVELEYTASPGGEPVQVILHPYTVGLYPTQFFEMVSMALLMLVLLAYEPLRRHPGQVCALLMVGYGAHRYLNEILRDDPRPVGLEAYGSLILIGTGLLFWLVLQIMPSAATKALVAETGTPAVPG